MARYFQLKEAVLISASGKDSPRYTNARLTNDTKNLKIGASCLAAALSPQGKTEGLFSVYRTEELSYLLTCDGGDRETVITGFKRFLVADRVEVQDLSESHSLFHLVQADSEHLLSEMPIPKIAHTFIQNADCLFAYKDRGFGPGLDIIAPKADNAFASRLLQMALPISEKEFLLARIKNGISAFPSELNNEHLFSESGLMEAVSFTKGCYAGQEVVERIESQGKTARVLRTAIFSGLDPLPEETEIVNKDNKRVGETITSAVDASQGNLIAFVRVTNDPALEGAEIFAGTRSGTSLRGTLLIRKTS